MPESARDFVGGYPSANTAAAALDAADRARAVTAYRFFYPTVSVEGIFNGNREIGLADNAGIGMAATGPRQVGFTLNSDTPYAAAVLDLSDGPMVIDVPPGPFIGLVDDHHQRWVMDLGIPGPDGGKGGRHLVVGPDHDGAVPDGYFVGHAATFKVLFALRVLPLGGDLPAALDRLRAVKVYPLSSAEDPQVIDIVDTTDQPMDSTSLRWESTLEFWKVLHAIIDAEPIVEEFRPLYGMLVSVGIEKGKPFAPDDRMTSILEGAARTGRDQMLVSGVRQHPE